MRLGGLFLSQMLPQPHFNTRCGFLVQADDQTFGMATVHGDRVLYFYFQDVIIHLEFQHQGHGTRLMNAVMRHIITHARDKAYIALFSARGLEPFYARYGFKAIPIDHFGAGIFFIKRDMKSEPSSAVDSQGRATLDCLVE